MEAKSYFQDRLHKNEVELKRISKLSLLLSMMRLAVFLVVAAIVYFFWGNAMVMASSIVVGIALFLLLVSRYTDAKAQKAYHAALKKLNEDELKALEGNFSMFQNGKEFLFDAHHFNQDIDLFGDGSFFQRINRTGTQKGKEKLAQLLNANDVEHIEEKQRAVKELAEMADWRQNYQVTASLMTAESESRRVVNWLKNYEAIIPNTFKYIPLLFSLGSLAVLVLYGIGKIPGIGVGFWMIIGLNVTGIYLKKINKLSRNASDAKEILSQYGKLIAEIEQQKFEAQSLNELKKGLETEGKTASDVLKQLSKEIGNLDQRNNMLIAIFLNGFLLWDLRYTYRIEKWITAFDEAIEKWFEVVEHFDAQNSLGNMAFTHAQYIYPVISPEKDEVLIAERLGHPLLKSEKRVDNDIHVADGNFFIITGANMAGKSTFLRTVALNLVMANCGLPVCAKRYEYRPIKLISSMRTSDSLQNDESYFFSELKRLKFIVDELEKDTYFIILDEILKGTNSKDKAEGSQKFVERLVASGSTGLIATHDLSLCTLADQYPKVENHYFDAEIINDELHFDYTFKVGICKNMNASFLLKKMQIV
ncbi:MAG: DNA mismatch repair protein MutS [Crocinitomicaceae bacterium]|nr:DNA mismatch repair protein MutS [Crocinitomicaceae bacterium]